MSFPKKSLGQNFLTSVGAVNKIVDTALNCGGPTSDITILEVGPGRGVLTEALLKKFDKVVAVEKDHELVRLLQEKFAKEITSGQLRLIEGDILELTPTSLGAKLPKNYAVVANIPYYITGQFLRSWLSIDPQPKYMVLMVQKEVAKRIVATNSKESLLSISVKVYGEPTYIETVKRGSFHPIPNVDSAILKIGNISKYFFYSLGAKLPKNSHPTSGASLTEESFFTVLRAGFTHKRKFLLRNLADHHTGLPCVHIHRGDLCGGDDKKIGECFAVCRIDPKARAEDLKPEDWRCLASSLRVKRSNLI